MVDMSEPIDTGALPAVTTRYLAAHQARELDPALGCFIVDVVANDGGHKYRGKHEIRDWLVRTAGEHTDTIELVAAQRVDDDHYAAVHGRIAELVIEL